MAISGITSKKERVFIELDAAELSPAQIRLVKSLNHMLTHVLSTDDEEDFFEGSAECMRMCASLIKQANFAEEFKDADNIPYAEQALEYSMDVLQDHIGNSKVTSFDN
jgi:hypothetical protein